MKTLNIVLLAILLAVGFASQSMAGVTVSNKQGLCLFARGIDYGDRAIWASNLRLANNKGPSVTSVQICHSQRNVCLDCRGLHDAKWYDCKITRDNQRISAYINKKKQFVISGAKCSPRINRGRI